MLYICCKVGLNFFIRDGPLEKRWGGGGEEGGTKTKNHARKNAKKKNSWKQEDKEKSSYRKKVYLIDFYLVYKICQCLLKIILI